MDELKPQPIEVELPENVEVFVLQLADWVTVTQAREIRNMVEWELAMAKADEKPAIVALASGCCTGIRYLKRQP